MSKNVHVFIIRDDASSRRLPSARESANNETGKADENEARGEREIYRDRDIIKARGRVI